MSGEFPRGAQGVTHSRWNQELPMRTKGIQGKPEKSGKSGSTIITVQEIWKYDLYSNGVFR
ncbi:MAG: hypothetical protein AB1847_05250 [bacterium]